MLGPVEMTQNVMTIRPVGGPPCAVGRCERCGALAGPGYVSRSLTREGVCEVCAAHARNHGHERAAKVEIAALRREVELLREQVRLLTGSMAAQAGEIRRLKQASGIPLVAPPTTGLTQKLREWAAAHDGLVDIGEAAEAIGSPLPSVRRTLLNAGAALTGYRSGVYRWPKEA